MGTAPPRYRPRWRWSRFTSATRFAGAGSRSASATGQERRRQRHRVIDNRRPDELALLKTLGDQSHPAAVPIQALEMITTLAAEGQASAKAEMR